MEHIHTLPQAWELEDDFQRALTWLKLGVDDILDVSVPWSIDPEVTWQEIKLRRRGADVSRAGAYLPHAVRRPAPCGQANG